MLGPVLSYSLQPVYWVIMKAICRPKMPHTQVFIKQPFLRNRHKTIYIISLVSLLKSRLCVLSGFGHLITRTLCSRSMHISISKYRGKDEATEFLLMLGLKARHWRIKPEYYLSWCRSEVSNSLSLFVCMFRKGHENTLANSHVLNTLSLYLTFISLSNKPVFSQKKIS